MKLKIHSQIYFTSLILLALAIPISQVAMSIAQFLLLFNWIVEGNLKSKLKSFFYNKIALVLTSFFILHVLGLICTTDFDYAIKDLRTKVPLVLLPLILSTSSSISKKQFSSILYFFICSVIAGSLISLYLLLTKNLIDIRDAFPFISHIRFSLCICLAIFSAIYLTFQKQSSEVRLFDLSVFLFINLCIILWLLSSLFIFESITGILILFSIWFTFSFYYIFIYTIPDTRLPIRIIRLSILTFNILLLTFASYQLRMVYNDVYTFRKVDYRHLPVLTPNSSVYTHDSLNQLTENGYSIGLFLCDSEMRYAWNTRSKIKYDSLDLKHQNLKQTLIRYLSSKGLHKDAEGVNALSKKDISAVEKGIANCYYILHPGIFARLHQIIWEYKIFRQTGDFNSHSVIQRFEFWKASIGIIKDNFWIGVGTGDMNIAFQQQYKKMRTELSPNNRWRSHNQYLSVFVGFGIIGLLWFLFTLFYPFYSLRRDYFNLRLSTYNLRLYTSFFIIIVLSMLTEDTLETQAGVTFFAFFNSFFLLQKKEN